MEPIKVENKFLEADAQKIAEIANAHAETAEGKELGGEQLTRKAVEIAVPVPAPATQSPADDATAQPLTKYTDSESPEIKAKIEDLLQTAATAGIETAVKEASNASPFVLDAFHDALAGKLYPYLKEKGLLK